MSVSSVQQLVTMRQGAELAMVAQRPTRPANDCVPGPVVDRLEVLYRTHRSAIALRCRRLLRNPQSAEDATHETFIRVARNLGKVPLPGDEALRWIYRVATNCCLNLLRDQSRTVPGDSQEPARHGEAAATTIDDVVDRDLIRRILVGVPAKTVTIAVLRHVDGLCEREVADLLGVSRRTVTYRLTEFRRRARDNLQRDQQVVGRSTSSGG
jgi:RNA polymerase sigma-70 factor (ECF subfamily)